MSHNRNPKAGTGAFPSGGLPFYKGQALGNDYFVIDAAEHPGITREEVIMLCDRHRGAGSDGVLYADLTAKPMKPAQPNHVKPASLADIPSGTGLVLPSPNGSALSFRAATMGARVAAGCLRNAMAVGEWAVASGGSVASAKRYWT